MKRFKIKSISELIIVGFLLVAAPLLLVLVQVGISVEELTRQSERAVFQAVEATRYSRMLAEHATAMERNARQFHVLGDFNLYKAYRDNHLEFLKVMKKLSTLSLLPTQRVLLDQLANQEKKVNDYLHDAKEFKIQAELEERFAQLSEQARSFMEHNNQLINREVSATQQTAAEMQKTFYWQAAAFLPLVIGFAIFFIVTITRLMRYMDEAIRRLGDGDFTRPIELKGPRDFEALGERLNWLRLRLSEVEAHKLKFLRHISHELKTPLTNIREGSELLTEELMGGLNESQREITQIIVDNSVQLQKLIEDLLRFGGAKGQDEPLKRTLFCLDEVVEEVLKKHKLAFVGKKITIDRTLKAPMIWADREKIRVVVDNLISNACKYSPIGGTIRVATVNTPTFAMLGVTDDGPGIPPEERERIFEAFYQAQGEYISHVKGTGLGLSIVKEYVGAHDGSVEVVEGKSGGAYFIVKIPHQKEVQDRASGHEE